jgi:hypothetical protein
MNIYSPSNDDFFIEMKEWFKTNPINISDYCVPLNVQKGQFNSFYGKKHTEETKLKISNAKKGKSTNKGTKRPWASENLKKIKHRSYGQFEIIEPNGKTLLITDLKSYCNEKNLNYTTMSSLSNGKWAAGSYKGYKSRKMGYFKIHR